MAADQDPFELMEHVTLYDRGNAPDSIYMDPGALYLVIAIALLLSYEGSSEAIRSIGDRFAESIRAAVDGA